MFSRLYYGEYYYTGSHSTHEDRRIPFVIRINPKATIKIVLHFKRYLLYFFGMSTPNIPKASMGTQVPMAKASIAAAPFFHEPDEAANIHIELSAPQGISPVRRPTESALPLKRHGFAGNGFNRRRIGTPHIHRPMSTTSRPQTVKSILLTSES